MAYRAGYLIKAYDISHALVVNTNQTCTFLSFTVL